MARTSAKSGFGTQFKVGAGDGPPETFTAIAELGDVDGPSKTQNFDDATNHGSDYGYEEPIPTTRTQGDMTFALNFKDTDTGHDDLVTDMEAGTLRNFQIIIPGAAYRWEGSGFVANVGDSYPVKGKMVRNVTIKPATKWSKVVNS